MPAISIAFQTDKPLSAYGPLAETVEQYGFDGVSVYNDLLYQPAWLPLLEIARQTRRVRIGPAAVNPFTTHPLHIAGQIALIDEASQGRAYLGLARGSWLDVIDLRPQKPITALREAFECIYHLLTRRKQPYEGQVFSLSGGDSLRWEILRSDIPFLLGSWGAKAIRTCRNLVSEVKIGGTANPNVLPQIQASLADTGQIDTPPQPGIVVGAVTVVDQDGRAARQLARREVALYLPVVARLDDSLEIEPDLLQRIERAASLYDFERAAALISDQLLAKFAFAGTPDGVAQQARTLFQAGVSRIEFGTPHGLSTQEGLRLLGQSVLPALRRD